MNIFTLLAKYSKFKERARYYVELAERIAAQTNDESLKDAASEMRELYVKLP